MSPQEIVTDDRPGNGTVWLLRLLAGFQFLGGIFFATFTWMLILVPLGIFHPQYQYQLRDVVFSITGATLAITGYFVWWNWFLYAFRGRFFRDWGVAVQLISILNHLGWLMYFPFLRYESFLAFLESAPGIAAWLLINLATSMILLPYFYFRSLEY
jgi:hypothetical protein